MATRSPLLLFFISSLLVFQFTIVTSSTSHLNDDDDEDLSFLEDSDDSLSSHPPHHEHTDSDEGEFNDGEDDFGNFDNFDPESYGGGEEDEPMPVVDEKDVVVLKEGNFSEFIEKNKHVMVEFYAPWCGHCQSLAPEYAAAATQLKEEKEDVKLAKVDATEENELAQKYDVQGFPTILFFIDGLHKPYPGQRHKDAIVTWIKKKTGPAVQNLTTTEEAEKILADDKAVVLAFLDSLVGDASKEFAAASKVEDDVIFYQTASPDVAKLFHIDPKSKLPSLVLLKKEAEKVSTFDGQFSKSAIVDFIFVNKLPLVNIFTRENAPSIFENPIKKQILLFATSKDSEKYLPIFQEAAKSFKGKLIFVYVEVDNEDIGTPVSEYFGVSGDGPNVLAYSGNDDNRKFMLDREVTEENIKTFSQGFLEDKLKPFYKSDPIPEINDGDVKIVVGNNFDEIVLDESKDVLLEIYAPWCGHCQALEPIYNKLAKHLSSVDSLVIAKMDGTTNEHPRAKADGFPTILFFPAGNKSFEPITVDVDRTVVAFYKFLKKNASIPFKLQKPAAPTTQKTESAEDAADSNIESTASTKDEL